MEYVLKTKEELDRLQAQNESKHYSISKELGKFTPKENSTILDVGCGAGTLIEYLQNNFNLEIHACDLSGDHVAFCKDKFGANATIFRHDISKTPTEEKYDYIFMRYVPHHMGEDCFKKAVINMKGSLAKGGELFIIDINGMFTNLGTTNKVLISLIEKLATKFTGDFNIGSRIPTILNEMNFKNIKYQIQLEDFKGDEREEEVRQMKFRFKLAHDSMAKIFSNKVEHESFVNLFIAELECDSTAYYISKFIVSGSNS